MNTLELDEKLILRMAEGDNDAFRDLYEQTSSAVYGFALSILRNVHDAENVMHDAYIRIHRSAAAYQPKGKPMAWILTIVRNLCYTRLKSGDICEDISQYEDLLHVSEGEQTVDRMVLQKALEVLPLRRQADRDPACAHRHEAQRNRGTSGASDGYGNVQV